ncbi:MAG: hypothetical protein AABX73_00490 [Nanoarchaeota archaeon]
MASCKIRREFYFGIFGILALIALLNLVSANHYVYRYHYDSPHLVYHYDNLHGGEFYYSFDDYRSHYRHDRAYFQKMRAVRFIDSSYNDRYDIVAGKTTGKAFGDDNKDTSASNWRNKYAYDYRIDGVNPTYNYYYKPVYDSSLGYYNWRY